MSISWNDEDDDLGPPPPPPDSPQPQHYSRPLPLPLDPIPDFDIKFTRSYARALTTDVPKPRVVKLAETLTFSSGERFKRSSPAIIIIKPPKDEKKCDGCHEKSGHLIFTERHVASQRKSSAKLLTEGTYCQDCVSAVAPKCKNCDGPRKISLPDAKYPFRLFCNECIAAYLSKFQE